MIFITYRLLRKEIRIENKAFKQVVSLTKLMTKPLHLQIYYFYFLKTLKIMNTNTTKDNIMKKAINNGI